MNRRQKAKTGENDVALVPDGAAINGVTVLNSLWSATWARPAFPFLAGDLLCDILIIGAGLTGVNLAYLLKKAGANVVVIDGGEVGEGITSGTTGKITVQHGLFYDRLTKEAGSEQARQYLAANDAGKERYLSIIEEESIACDLEKAPAYLYSFDDAAAIAAEARACESLGLPVSFLKEMPLPLPVAAAVKMEEQYAFHPLRYLAAIAKGLPIYTGTRAIAIEGRTVKTNRGQIKADQIVLACHYPFINTPGYYFMRMYQSRSYLLAFANGPQIGGMYIDAREDGLSFRNWRNLLVMAGEDHHSGDNQKGGRYAALRREMAALYPQAQEVYHWSNQDCVPLDRRPYIGPFSPKLPGVFIATGYNKWGITNSMAAALILSDLLAGRPNPWADVFSPQRHPEIWPLLRHGFTSAGGFSRSYLYMPPYEARLLPPGHGGVVSYRGKKFGVYRDEEGNFFPVSARCPHLGCQLEWNPDEKSWDCPCHGSRFDHLGRLLNHPAQTDLRHEP